MDLRRLEIFAKVAELGSFSRAAEALFLTQPTVSEHVRALEDELGVQLLDRLGRGAQPTPAGRLLLDYAARMLALGREARQAIDRYQGRVSGALVIGGSTIPGEYVLPALVGAFRAKHPEVSISLLIGSSRDVSLWVEEGRAELGVTGARPSARALHAKAIMSDELVIVVPAEHPWAERKTVSLADVRAARLGLARGARARARRSRAGPRGVPGRGRDGLDAGDQAGGPRGRRRLDHLAAGGRGRVPRAAARRPPDPRPEGRPRLLARHPPGAHALAPRAGVRHVRGIASPRRRVLTAWARPARRYGSPPTPPAPAERRRWLLEISRRCSPRSSVRRTSRPTPSATCSLAWPEPTTRPSTGSVTTSPSWRPSTFFRPSWTTRIRGVPAPRPTRCRTSTRWAARCCSPSPSRASRGTSTKGSSPRSSAAGATRSPKRAGWWPGAIRSWTPSPSTASASPAGCTRRASSSRAACAPATDSSSPSPSAPAS